MAFDFGKFSSRIREVISQRVVLLPSALEGLRSTAQQNLSRFPQWGRLVAAVSCCVWLGTCAEEGSLARAELAWRKAVIPPERVTNATLESLGLTPLLDPIVTQRLLRGLPHLGLSPGEFWVSISTRALVRGNPDGESPTLWASPRAPSPTAGAEWEPLGFGWPALAQAIEKLEAQGSEGRARDNAARFSRVSAPEDPRQLRY